MRQKLNLAVLNKKQEEMKDKESPMKSFSRKKSFILIVSMSILVVCVHLAPESHPAPQPKTLGEIYRSGTIKFKPVLKISLDSIPDRIHAKNFSKLVQGKDKLYVSDLSLSDIKVFDLAGRFIKKFGVKGKGPADLFAPSHMCFTGDRLVVWEIGNKRFSFFSPDGKFIKVEKPKLKGRLDYMRVLDDGRFILQLERTEANKEKKEIFEWCVLELYSRDMKYLKDVYRQKQHLYKYFKKRPYSLYIPFSPMLNWDVLPGGKIVVGFPEKYEIKIIYIDTGQKKVFSRDYAPVRVTEVDKESCLASRLRREGGTWKRGAGKFYRDNVEFPEFKPAFKRILTDKEGHILVFDFSESDWGRIVWGAISFDVFDSNGSFINHVKIEKNEELSVGRIFPVKGNEFWCTEDDDVNIMFVKYKAM